MVTKYGVISDVHGDPRIVGQAIEVLEREGAEKLLVNGDIGNQQGSLKESQSYVAFVLDSIGKSGLEAFVQPGSHETLLAFGPVIDSISEDYSNLIDVTKNQRIEQVGYDLVFLPGSDFSCGGEYQIGNDSGLPSRNYLQLNDSPSLTMFDTLEEGMDSVVGMRRLDPNMKIRMFHYSNMQDLKKLVTNPEKTVMVCHVPRKFDNLESAVDMAEFGEVTEDFELQGDIVRKGSVYPLPVAKQVVQAGYPVEIMRANRGNEDLTGLYNELGITKAVSGHFHESGHRACDGEGNHVEEGKMVNKLFWNSGHLDVGQTGILSVDGEKVSYRNIQL
jgi:hypothetical protein